MRSRPSIVPVVLTLVAGFIVAGCGSPAVRLQITDTDVIEAPFDDVWAAVVASLAERDFTIEAIEKESGLITTKHMIFLDGIYTQRELERVATMPSNPLATWVQARLSINVFVKAAAGGTKVKITTNIEAYDSNVSKRWHPCYSKGVIEQQIFDQIRASL